MRRIALLLMGLCWPFALWAEAIPETVRAAQVVFLGEIHDNPVHHEVQARGLAHWRRVLSSLRC